MNTDVATGHPAVAAMDNGMVQFLTFTLGSEEYGVDIMRVREVKGWTETTRLPGMPGFLRGVLNLRGVIVPIFDLRARFGGALTQATEKHVVIILAVGKRISGILVDAVSDILTVNAGAIKPAPAANTSIDHGFVTGLIAVENRMVALLEMERLLDIHTFDSASMPGAPSSPSPPSAPVMHP